MKMFINPFTREAVRLLFKPVAVIKVGSIFTISLGDKLLSPFIKSDNITFVLRASEFIKWEASVDYKNIIQGKKVAPASSSSNDNYFCKECGSRVFTTDKFCGQCGSTIN